LRSRRRGRAGDTTASHRKSGRWAFGHGIVDKGASVLRLTRRAASYRGNRTAFGTRAVYGPPFSAQQRALSPRRGASASPRVCLRAGAPQRCSPASGFVADATRVKTAPCDCWRVRSALAYTDGEQRRGHRTHACVCLKRAIARRAENGIKTRKRAACLTGRSCAAF